MYSIRDINLKEEGLRKIDWVRSNMPILNELERLFIKEQPFKGIKVSLSIHLEAKTAYLATIIKAGGAKIRVTGSNPLSTQDDIAAALVSLGLEVFAWYDATEEEYGTHLRSVLEFGPNVVIDDGGDLVSLLHTEMTDLLPEVYGGCEETTTGIVRLNALDRENRLKFPMMSVNDADCKHLFDNRYGTGQSVWDGILRTTNLVIAGKTVVVAGYGWCSKGIAMRAKGLGASVIITEIDPVKAIEAVMDGFAVMNMDEASYLGDFFVTATGCKDVITEKHFYQMKEGAILSNAGHFNVEVSYADLERIAVKITNRRKNITGYLLSNGKTVNLLGEGRLVNLTCADGHPAEIMDMSFAIQALCAKYIVEQKGKLSNHVHKVPKEIDEFVALFKLKSLGITIDTLTEEQHEYMNSWEL
ncbi:MAG: adenosylhomocysteinase [Clostridia bacterium]|nr:adenosylhomocysteinase [Clostridia bacterium]